jgi:U3 small nucleolar RNA-associated protein 18
VKSRQQRKSESDDDSDSSDEEVGILQRAGDLLTKSTDQLPKGTLDIKRMKDANSAKRAAAMVRALEFHPSASVLLVGGYHKTLDLFQVDGHTNPKIQSVHIQGFPISNAHFSKDGREVVLTGHRRRFFVYDMMAGKITPIRGIRGIAY